MKTAIYIEDGVMQLVITPETEFEKGAFKTIEGREASARIFKGGFYDCRGGWVRQLGAGGGEDSLIVRVDHERSETVAEG